MKTRFDTKQLVLMGLLTAILFVFSLPLFSINPFLAFVQRFVPRMLDGLLIGLIYKGVSKLCNSYAACFVTGFFSAFLNTAFFMSALVLLFGNTEWIKPSDAYRYGMITVIVLLAILIIIGMPLANALF